MFTYYHLIAIKLARLFGTLKSDCCYIDRIPEEILCNIFKFLKSSEDFVNCYNTCKKWRSVIRIPSLQKEVRCKYYRTKCTKSMNALVFLCICLINFTAHNTILVVGGNFQEARNFESIAAHSKDIRKYPFGSISRLLSKKSIALLPSLVHNIPPLPKKSINTSLLITEENNLLSVGGNLRTCYVLRNGKWIKHSRLNKNRFGGVFVDMPNGIYVFGGKTSPHTTEFLPKGSSTWQFGPELRLFEVS